MPEEARLGGAAAHMKLVRTRGELLLAVARSNGVELRRVRNREVQHVISLPVNATSVEALPIDEDNDHLLVGCADGRIRIFEPDTGEPVTTVDVGNGEVSDLGIVLHDDGTNDVAAIHDGGVAIWTAAGRVTQLPQSAGLGTARGYKLCIYRAFDSQWLACAYSDESLAVWDLGDPGDGPTSRQTRAHTGQIWSLIAIDGPGSDYAVASGSADGTVRMWRPIQGNGLLLARTLTVGATVRRLSSINDGEVPMLVTAAANGAVALWRFDGSTEKPMRPLVQHLGEAWSLASAVTADGGMVIASGDMHGGVEVTQLRTDAISDRTGRDLYRANGTAWVAASGVTPDGAYIACAGVDQMVHVLGPDAGSTAPVIDMHGHISTVRSLASAGNALDPHLISGGADRRVIDWDPLTGDLRRELPLGHQGEVWALTTFLMRGTQYAASGSADGTVRMCPLTSGGPTILAADAGAVNAIVATPAGEDTLLTVASNRGVRVISALASTTLHTVSTIQVSAACEVFDGNRHLVITARPHGETCVIDIIDPVAGAITSSFRYTHSSTQVSALAAARIGDDVLIFGGCDDGQILVWQIDGALVGKPARCGNSTVRSMGIAEVGFAPLSSGGTINVPAVFAANDDGLVRIWPIATGSLLRSGGSIGAEVHPASILLQDQPTDIDSLSRAELVETIHDVLMSSSTKPPVVIGVHAPWGQGKSSVLRQLRYRLDPTAGADPDHAQGQGDLAEHTHELVPIGKDIPGRIRRRLWGGPVRTRLTRAWAWRQVQKPPGKQSLGYEMRPRTDLTAPSAITIWFNPWMYETPEQVWAGLTREILTGITDRLPAPQRERLWFDLNLRRTDPASMRKRILASYIPRTLLGMVVALIATVIVVVAVSAMAVTAVRTLDLTALIGSSAVIILTVLGFLANITMSSFSKVRSWMAPGVLNRPTAHGVSAAHHGDSEWKATRDPMESGQRGYLYMLQHDVGEVLDLATRRSPVVILIDDLDRCGPPIVADTVEAVNLFLNKAFGPCHFVIALDPATVAAQLETVYDSIRRRANDDPSSFGHLQHTGWRFMEKILDLPIRLPRVRDQAISTYLDRLLDSTNGHHPPTTAPPISPSPVSTPPKPATRAERKAARLADGELDLDVGGDGAAGVQLAERLEKLPPVRLALRTAVLTLPARNPRQTKAFINLWRFYMVLDYRTGYLSSSLSAIEKHSIEMARFVELMVRWPWLLDALGAHRGEEVAARRTILAELLDACGDDDRWSETIESAGLDPRDTAIQGLRNLFRRPGTDSEVFASIAVRYL
ncbi:WD40 repeat protein [Allocatelliglobosispora scoriae]|uniref:WD40 repeat protein n=1 Tax=Allocatelliglobosispora scoriae TaxID=643052 RepID=A0A841C242_9ACTN|nr:P-loop NTPase fold protein [Allocatelliglobosispora scoriae]MBB5873828.1 WD40 repeat protein [Allocatelliglobosispora scoriae]